MVGETGLEPVTPGLEGRCSIQLSYSPVIPILALFPSLKKCDAWVPETGGQACYVDLIPHDESVFAEWQRAEGFCRALVKQMIVYDNSENGETITLVVRQAIASQAEGFGVTAYFSADGTSPDSAMVRAMVAFSNAILSEAFLQPRDQS